MIDLIRVVSCKKKLESVIQSFKRSGWLGCVDRASRSDKWRTGESTSGHSMNVRFEMFTRSTNNRESCPKTGRDRSDQ